MSVLRDLDELHSVDDDIAGHFDNNRYLTTTVYQFSWTAGRCGHQNCKPSDYVDLHRAIQEVSRAIANKEKALAQARVAGRGESAKQLAEALRSEAGIQRQVMEELV